MEAGLYRPVSPELRSGVGWLVEHDGEVKVPLGYSEVKYERSKQEEKNNIKKKNHMSIFKLASMCFTFPSLSIWKTFDMRQRETESEKRR